ncbi:hypothetical protein VTN31DRAFT_5624 [Thermomyces dupontii]|uniref:uncharacterized protein n=1 Tax=Talaromyces thermophilus TaxID=28565 RepID=UPI003742FAC8
MSFSDVDFLPTTPPTVARAQPIGSADSRNPSFSSACSYDSSPDSAAIGFDTSTTADGPNFHYGPQILPKIRTQDVVIDPVSSGGPCRHRRVLSNTRNPPGFMPYPPTRPPSLSSNNELPELSTPISPVSPGSGQTISPTLSSPISLPSTGTRKNGSRHSRSSSTSSIDSSILSRYGYPTYRQLPKYVPLSHSSPVTPVDPTPPFPATYGDAPVIQVAGPMQSSVGAQVVPSAVPSPQYDYLQVPSASTTFFGSPHASSSTSTLLSYLTEPTPAINLVRNISVTPTRGNHDYFWWDVRQVRRWSSFSLSTFNKIEGLIPLLKTPIPSFLTPKRVVAPSQLSPESESALIKTITEIYAPRVNAALRVSLGADHLRLYPASEVTPPGTRANSGPHFIANYPWDTEVTSTGMRRGRLVGIVRSFDRWNTAMRNEPPHRRVEYLRGLAHLQRCMREHSCRYGFIVTEIELVCVRAGCDDGDDVPYFGLLELSAPIALKEFASTDMDTQQPTTPGAGLPSPSLTDPINNDHLDIPMTASLALYFLLMLSKSVPLPNQPSGHLNVGGPGALTRQRILPEPKDKWIPEPQLGEKRDAKRVRGWIWPQDPWHRREGARPKSEARAKRWHK